MANWLRRILGISQQKAPDAGRVLQLERQLQRVKLDLQEREEKLAQKQKELQRRRAAEEDQQAQSRQAYKQHLFGQLAAPIAQLRMQAHLVQNEGRPVRAEDMAVIVRRMITVLESEGLKIDCDPGEIVGFDPNRHHALDAGFSPDAGERVVVKLPGISYNGTVLQKAGVARQEGT